MYIINGVAYAGEPVKDIVVTGVKPLDDMMLLITFSTGEKRLYDATQLLTMPAFKSLEDKAVFEQVSLDHGVVVWCDGDIDIAPETMYVNSYAYNEVITS